MNRCTADIRGHKSDAARAKCPRCGAVTRDAASKRPISQSRLSSADRTPTVTYRKDGSVLREVWSVCGKTHRIGAPAYVEYREDGSVSEEWWYCDGKYQRSDGPAFVEYREDGSALREVWMWDGKPMSESCVRAPVFGVARDNAEALDMLKDQDLASLTPEHPAVILALALYPGR